MNSKIQNHTAPEIEIVRERFAGGSSPASEQEILFAQFPALWI